MVTALQIITDSMKELGALAQGEVPTADEAADGLTVLNDMLSMWQLDSLMISTIFPQVFNLVAGQQTYTIGPAGNFNVARPDTIGAAYMRDAAGNDYPVYVTNNYIEYANIVSKQVTGEYPTVLYYDSFSPTQTLYLWPIPSTTAYKLVLWTSKDLTSFDNLNDDLTLAAGYSLAMKKNLAILLAPRYGKVITQETALFAQTALSRIKAYNYVGNTLDIPNGIPNRGYFNIYTGGTV